MARQRSRIRWLWDGDANTKLFHVMANGQRIKNVIPAINLGDELITDQSHKGGAFDQAYEELLGTIQNRE
jgi:hypothetical protein